jgi:hypothetical protein
VVLENLVVLGNLERLVVLYLQNFLEHLEHLVVL